MSAAALSLRSDCRSDGMNSNLEGRMLWFVQEMGDRNCFSSSWWRSYFFRLFN